MRKLLYRTMLITIILGIAFPAIAQKKSETKASMQAKNTELVGLWQRIIPIGQKPTEDDGKATNQQVQFAYTTFFKQINADGTFLNITQHPRSFKMNGSVKGKWSIDSTASLYKEEVQTHYLDKSLEGSSVSIKFELSKDSSLLKLFIVYPNGSKDTELWQRVDLRPEIMDQMVSQTQKGLLKM